MRARAFALAGSLTFVLAGCDPRSAQPDTLRHFDGAARAEGEKQAVQVEHDARLDAIDARLSALENEMAANEETAQDQHLSLLDREVASLRNSMMALPAPTALPGLKAKAAPAPAKKIKHHPPSDGGAEPSGRKPSAHHRDADAASGGPKPKTKTSISSNPATNRSASGSEKRAGSSGKRSARHGE